MTIARTDDWPALVIQCGDDLGMWHQDWQALNWPVMIAQPGWHLLTDHAGSWCLLEPMGNTTMAHLIIARDQRGKMGLEIARNMLAWIEANGLTSLIATVTERKTRLFLLWLGFEVADEETGLMVWQSRFRQVA